MRSRNGNFRSEFRGQARQPIRPAPRADAAGDADHNERIEGEAVAIVHTRCSSFVPFSSRAACAASPPFQTWVAALMNTATRGDHNFGCEEWTDPLAYILCDSWPYDRCSNHAILQIYCYLRHPERVSSLDIEHCYYFGFHKLKV